MAQDLISSSRASPAPRGFSLIEVVVALGLLAVSMMALLSLQGAVIRSAAAASRHQRAAELADAIDVELCRLRDLPGQAAGADRLDALAGLMPPEGDSRSPLRLVAGRDGSRVIRESDADNPVNGIPSAERYYLVQVRQAGGPLAYLHGSGYLAATLTIRWPYLIATGRSDASAVEADSAQVSVVVLNTALSP